MSDERNVPVYLDAKVIAEAVRRENALYERMNGSFWSDFATHYETRPAAQSHVLPDGAFIVPLPLSFRKRLELIKRAFTP